MKRATIVLVSVAWLAPAGCGGGEDEPSKADESAGSTATTPAGDEAPASGGDEAATPTSLRETTLAISGMT